MQWSWRSETCKARILFSDQICHSFDVVTNFWNRKSYCLVRVIKQRSQQKLDILHICGAKYKWIQILIWNILIVLLSWPHLMGFCFTVSCGRLSISDGEIVLICSTLQSPVLGFSWIWKSHLTRRELNTRAVENIISAHANTMWDLRALTNLTLSNPAATKQIRFFNPLTLIKSLDHATPRCWSIFAASNSQFLWRQSMLMTEKFINIPFILDQARLEELPKQSQVNRLH